MTIKMTITKTSQNWWESAPKVERIELTGTTESDLFAQYFRDYQNRYKYANSVQVRIDDDAMAQRYRAWVSDVNNYASNGGDMW